MTPLGQIQGLQGKASTNTSTTPQVSPQQISLVKSFLSQKGMSAETMVRQICGQRGINVDEFMQQFKDVTLP